MARPLGSEVVVVIRPPLVIDPRDGSAYRDWPNASRTTLINCNVQPFPLAEKLNFEFNLDREFSRTAIRVWAPAGTRFEPEDRIEWLGTTYNVFGHTGPWKRFSGLEHHVQIIARVMEG